MLNTTDLYLGFFLILCGFALSLFNLRRLIKGGTVYSSILLSENVILMCIGIAFVSRSVYSLNPSNVNMEGKSADLTNIATKEDMNCGFVTLLLSYGPLIVSMVNSFLTLIIDNYMHFKILKSLKEKSEENIVQIIGDDNNSERKFKSGDCNIWKKYFSSVTITLQWIIPILTALAMYPIDVNEISMSHARMTDNSCMNMLDLSQEDCPITYITNYTLDPSKYIHSSVNFFESQNYENRTNNTEQVETVLSNVLRIINKFNNSTNFSYATIKSLHQPKVDRHCMKMCYTDNKSLLSYMFIMGFASYFVPITISTIILTRIHGIEITKPKTKVHMTHELLCNILFWTPVMFDTFLSLILCAYSTHGIRTSIFNVFANVYQAVKNFMNTKYFKENTITPV